MRDNSRQNKQAFRLRAQSSISAIAATLAMLTSMASVAYAQNEPYAPERWLGGGASVGRGRSFHFGAIALPESVGCDTLGSGMADQWRAELLTDLPLSPRLSTQIRLGAVFESGELRAHSRYPPVFQGSDGNPAPAAFDQVLTFSRTLVTATLGTRLAATEHLSFLAGLELAHEISTDQTAQQEAIAPGEFLFSNRSRVYVLRSGEVVAPASVTLGLLVGAGYEVPIGARAVLVPELIISAPLTSRAADVPWRSLAFTAGLSIRLPLLRLDEPPVIVKVDTPRHPPPPLLEAAVSTSPVVVSVRIDEYDSTVALPLLNQLFFAEGAAGIPSRYRLLERAGVSDFSMSRLTGSALDVYYDLLNIVGSRMRLVPAATLSITGFRNSRERGTKLTRDRAESLRDYLVESWGISSRRIRIAAGGLPTNPAVENSEEGLEENARAELVPSDPNITAPVIQRHVQRVATPPSVVFFPNVVAEAGVSSWTLDIMQEQRPWRSFRGNGELPASIRWDWRSDSSTLPSIPMQLSYSMSVTDLHGQSVVTPSHGIEVRYESLQKKLENRQNDTIIESYSLLLFNYDSPRVSSEDEILLRAIAGNIREGALVRITGYTDSLGLESHNRELANQRAFETARLLRGVAPKGVTIVISDQGGERERFPYATPEGRSHCRTVVIEVRTPATNGL